MLQYSSPYIDVQVLTMWLFNPRLLWFYFTWYDFHELDTIILRDLLKYRTLFDLIMIYEKGDH